MEWSVAVFSSRESLQVLSSSIAAILKATRQTATIIDIILNGNLELANEVARHVETIQPVGNKATMIRVWYLPVADKAHSWNEYVHSIQPESETVFFMDGYAQVMPDALNLIRDGLSSTPKAIAASGVPSFGRSAASQTELMVREGGIHGSLYAVRGSFLQRVRSADFRLPLGLYRTDGVLGAVISFDLDPAKNDWDTGRIFVHPQATWKIRPFAARRIADLRSHFKKVMRQSQGILENLAVREHLAIQRKTPQSLSRTAAELVRDWIDGHRSVALMTFLRNPLCMVAAWTLLRSRDWSDAAVPPRLITNVDLNEKMAARNR
jgi:hypothetical protein